jgi:DNA mismatch repair protein MutS2
MNKKALNTLEYFKIIDLLCEQATCDGGRRLCRKLHPMTDVHDITTALQQTSDALTRIFQKGSLSFSGVHNLDASFKRLEAGGVLSQSELLQVASLLEVSKRAKQYARSDRSDMPADSIERYFTNIEPLTQLCDEIRRCLLSETEVSDDASPTLKQIRRQMKNAGDRIRTAMNGILNQSRSYLQDAVITMRNDRYCLPVKAEYRSQIQGMIHDQSSTGSTLFIEPMAVVKLNNDLKELSLKEQEEIAIILASLSARATEEHETIANNYRLLVRLDFIFAKAQLARLYNGSMPIYNTEGRIHIRQGRHPLLNKHTVVPVTVMLGDTFDQLIITGPNTGGKTVTLKTVGLFSLMGQAGLFIPAADRSELCIFTKIFADIGDEQSIEQNLSTFSSHMTNIVSILDHVDEKSLVLFDELCAGTDPTEGAAIATSILASLHSRGIRTLATTHYSEIKVYALSTEGVENACCEFDLETLSPTYRLLIGIPGKSNAFAISGKLGLSASILDDARTRLDAEDETFEDLVADLESKRVAIEDDLAAAALARKEAEDLKHRYETKQNKLNEQRDRVIREANEQARNILKDAKDVADETIRNINKYGNDAEAIRKMEKERARVRDKISDKDKKLADKQKKQQQENHNVPKNLRIGDTVRVLSMNVKGTVHTLPNAKGDLTVQMGIMKSKVNIRDLVLVEDTPVIGSKTRKTSTGSLKMSKSASVSTEINLIGKNVDEALMLLDKYLDDAYLAHIPSVRIVHGKGTGTLRNAVHQHLKRQSYVKSYRLGEFGEGDAGVTIAELE